MTTIRDLRAELSAVKSERDELLHYIVAFRSHRHECWEMTGADGSPKIDSRCIPWDVVCSMVDAHSSGAGKGGEVPARELEDNGGSNPHPHPKAPEESPRCEVPSHHDGGDCWYEGGHWLSICDGRNEAVDHCKAHGNACPAARKEGA